MAINTTKTISGTFSPERYHEWIKDQVVMENVPTVKEPRKIAYKYAEDQIVADFAKYLENTYSEHYKTEDEQIECFDAWIALGDSTPTFRNTALKYLWRYGKKNGNNKADLLKALHYTLMCLYVDHYRNKKGE